MIIAPEFVGRDQEVAALASALAHPPAVVLIEGEAGIGKSRLVKEYLAAVGGSALVAWCPPFRRPHTLGPVADAVRQATGDVRGLGLTAVAGALRPLFPEWAGDLPSAPEPAEDGTAARHRVFRALAELIGGLGLDLLVLEDAHWADDATLEFLLFLASRPLYVGAAGPGGTPVRPGGTPLGPGGCPPVSLVITCRPEDVPPGSLLPRLARLAAGPQGLRLTLPALDVAGTARMVSSMLAGEQVSDRFAGFVHEHTGGLPLAVEESVRLMAARTDLRRRSGRWMRRELAELAVPPPVREAVLERVGRLDPDAQAVLAAAAVLGEPAAEATLAAVTGFAPGRARAGLSRALACGLLAESGRALVSFGHVLACRAVYESVPGPERRMLHGRAGQALEGLSPPPLVALARHFREAGDAGPWARYGEQAADLARAAGDEATAAVLLHDLVTTSGLPVPDLARLADRIVLLALPADGQLRDLADALRGILGAGGLAPAEEAMLRFQLGRTLSTMQESDASRAELERAVAGLPPDSLQAARAMMLLGWPQGGTRPAAEYLRWLRRAAAAGASVPPAERLRLLVDRVTVLLILGEGEGWAEAARIPWEPDAPRDRLQIIRAQGNIGEAAITWGRYTDARRRLEHATALAERYDSTRLRGSALAALAHLDWLTGAWRGLAERAAALAADGEVFDRLRAGLVGGLLRSAAGDEEQAAADLAWVADEAGRRGAVEYVMEPTAALARLHLARGDVTHALKVTEEPIGAVARTGTWLWAADLVPVRVSALVAANQVEEGAAVLVNAFTRGLRGRDAPAPRAGLALCRAVLAEARGQHVRAAALFGRAGGAWQALPRPYSALLARERQACCLLAAGQRDTGVALLAEVMSGLSHLGASGDSARAARALRENGVRLRRPGAGRPGYGKRLSPRELEVVRLLVRGRSNRDIADELYLSPKTVAGHVASAMRKLGAASPAALAARAVETGITADPPAGT
jgi:DNA-binding CsgD family transcriptional regulator